MIGATGSAVGDVAGKTVAAVKGQVGVAHALLTTQVETHLRNAQEELREEQVEIALYTRIEVFATAVGDRDTAQLARSIRRDEERMAKFLTTELTRLVKELVRVEIPRDQRAASSRSRSSRSTSRSRTSRSTSSRNTAPRDTPSRSSSAASRSRAGAGSTRSRSGAGTTRPRSGGASRSSRSRATTRG